jgi:hypothetical protein
MHAQRKQTSHTSSNGKVYHVPNRLSWEYPSWSVTLKEEQRLKVAEKNREAENRILWEWT